MDKAKIFPLENTNKGTVAMTVSPLDSRIARLEEKAEQIKSYVGELTVSIREIRTDLSEHVADVKSDIGDIKERLAERTGAQRIVNVVLRLMEAVGLLWLGHLLTNHMKQ